jgi:hypothetical protein
LGDHKALQVLAAWEGPFTENSVIENGVPFNVKPTKYVITGRTLWRLHEEYRCTIAPWDSDFVVADGDLRVQYGEAHPNREPDASAGASADNAVSALINSQQSRLGRSYNRSDHQSGDDYEAVQ